MATEKRVYVIDLDNLPNKQDYMCKTNNRAHIKQYSDEEVIEIAERAGDVYTLAGFVKQFNDDININSDCHFIRIIDVEIDVKSDKS